MSLDYLNAVGHAIQSHQDRITDLEELVATLTNAISTASDLQSLKEAVMQHIQKPTPPPTKKSARKQ